MVDLNTLSIFTPKNGIYGGVNKANFKSIEFWLQIVKENIGKPSNAPNSLGLFGPASVGKTTTASVIANYLRQPLIPLNCASLDQNNFFEGIYENTRQLHPNSYIHDVLRHIDAPYNTDNKTYSVNRCVVLLDECHELSSRNQGQFLSILDGSTNRIQNAVYKKYPIAFTEVTWIFSTTDSGKLLYPLSTRLNPIVFNEYSEADVVEIVKLKYPVLEEGAALVLSRAAKLVPRTALNLTKQYITVFRDSCYTRATALSYVKSIRQTNEYGLDNTDEKILDFLKQSKITQSKARQFEKAKVVSQLARLNCVLNPSEEYLTEAIKLQMTYLL
jgi:Holliday junction resolvasome RuvABC ATP-dependent DNA helicase subunit